MRGGDFYGSLVLYGVVVPFTPAASISAASAVSSIRTATVTVQPNSGIETSNVHSQTMPVHGKIISGESSGSHRSEATEATEALKRTDLPNEIQELRRSKNSFNALADNEEWLADNFKKIIHSHDPPSQGDDAKQDAHPFRTRPQAVASPAAYRLPCRLSRNPWPSPPS